MTIGIKAPGYYVQGAGELDRLGKYVKKLGTSFLIVGSPNNKKRVGTRIMDSLNEVGKQAVYWEFGGQCSKQAIADAVMVAENHGCDALLVLAAAKPLILQRQLQRIWVEYQLFLSLRLHPMTLPAAVLPLFIMTKALL